MSFSDPAEWMKRTSGPEREETLNAGWGQSRGGLLFRLFIVRFTTLSIKNGCQNLK